MTIKWIEVINYDLFASNNRNDNDHSHDDDHNDHNDHNKTTKKKRRIFVLHISAIFLSIFSRVHATL